MHADYMKKSPENKSYIVARSVKLIVSGSTIRIQNKKTTNFLNIRITAFNQTRNVFIQRVVSRVAIS